MIARRRLTVAVGLALAAASAACSAILGLDAPPSETGSGSDASSDATLAEAGVDSAPPVVCTPLGAADDAGATYNAIDAAANWQLVDIASFPGFQGINAFLGGTFDGKYAYFAGQGTRMARYDTTQPMDQASSWTTYSLAGAGGFGGAAFDGRYVYYAPNQRSGVPVSVAARYDTQGPFNVASSWTLFDMTALSADGGAVTRGYTGVVLEGKYLYFIPHNDGAPFGRVARFDNSLTLDAGTMFVFTSGDAGGDGGGHADGGSGGGAEAGVDSGSPGFTPGGFDDPSQWTTFDVAGVDPTATGFAGGVVATGSVYLVPLYNDVYDAQVHNGGSGIAARHVVSGSFELASSWNVFDTTTVNGLAQTFMGGATDGRNVYYVPHASGVAARLDTTASGGFTATTAWSTYDTQRIVAASDGGNVQFLGGAFDGRFITFVPQTPTGPVTRVDTRSTFTADCAWSWFDPSGMAPGSGGAPSFAGAVFDGANLIFIPTTQRAVFAKFTARSPSAMPDLPDFHGSFL